MTYPTTSPSNAALAPTEWPWARRSQSALSSEPTGWRESLVRRWHGTSATMEQPPLDHHYVVLHLGGPKRVHRRCEGAPLNSIVEARTLTIVPAGTQYVWRTEGPIGFAHLYLRPGQVEAVALRDFDLEPARVALLDRVGCRDLLLEPALARLVDEVGRGVDASHLLLDALLDAVLVALVARHSSRSTCHTDRPLSLAPHRLRRVLDFIEAHLGDGLRLADLAAAGGSSQAHFSRAFREATGFAPYDYVLRRRVEAAKLLLLSDVSSIESVALRTGFRSARQFGVMFRRSVGVAPKRFQLLHRS